MLNGRMGKRVLHSKKVLVFSLLLSIIFSPITVLASEARLESDFQGNTDSVSTNFDASLIQDLNRADSSKNEESAEIHEDRSVQPIKENMPLDGSLIDSGHESSLSMVGGETKSISIGVTKGGVVDPGSGSSQGSFIYDFVFEIPPGRNNSTPELRLSYSSKNVDDSGFGYGWKLSIPSIERQNKTGFDDMYSTTSPGTFYSSLSGELISASSSNYVAKNEDSSSLRYSFNNNIWTAKDRAGNTYEFGVASTSRQDDPTGTGKIFKWMLQKVTDTNGNSISYSYTKDFGEIYPAGVTYTDTATTTGPFSVNFTLGLQATSSATSTASGFAIKTRYQVNQVSVLINGATTRSYALTYGTGDNGNRTILKGITETGQNSTGFLSLPATLFEYSTSTAAMATSTTLNPSGVGGYYVNNNDDRGVISVDINGDGLMDTAQSWEIRNSSGVATYSSKIVSLELITNGAEFPGTYSFPCVFTWTPNYSGVNASQDGGGRLIDVNGDGLPDLICGSDTYLNNGSNWVSSTTWNTPIAMNTTDGSGNYIDAGNRFADVNGDGLLDILRGYSQSGTYTSAVYLNNGHGWTQDVSWVLPNHLDFSSAMGDGGGRVVDINGDGLADLFFGLDDAYIATSTVYINNGHGWTVDTSWNLPDGAQAQSPGLMFSDINADHLIDFSIATGTLASSTDAASFSWNDNRVYLNTGTGWKRDMSRWVPLAYSIRLTASGTTQYETGVRVGNIDGNGLTDVQASATVGTVGYTGEYFSQGDIPDLLNKVTESAGQKITISYRSTSSFQDSPNNSSIINPNLAYHFPVVHQLLYDTGIGATTSEVFEYSGGKFYFGGPTDRRFGGFAKVTKIDGMSNRSVSYYHTGAGTATSTGQYSDNQAKIGKPYRLESYDTGSTTYRVTINKWDSFTQGGTNFVRLGRTTSLSYDKQVTHKDSAQEFTYSTTTGELLQQVAWGEVIASNDGSFSDTGSDKFTTNVTYASSSTAPLSKPSYTEILDQSNNIVKGTRYFYDDLSLGSISKGNLTHQNDLKTGTSTYVQSIRNIYNSLGLVVQKFGPRGATTTLSYDPLNLYPGTTTNALGHVTTAQYNYYLGIPSEIRDPNGSITKSVYDPLNRVTAVLRPDPASPTNLATTTAYSYVDTGFPRRIQETNYLSSGQAVNKYTYLDGSGREVETRTQAEAANTFKVKDTKYVAYGLYQESLPYFGSGVSYTGTSSPAVSALITTYSYDPLQRIIKISNVIGSTTSSYTHWKESTVDPNGKKKDLYKDAYGNLIAVAEYIGTTTATTTYFYDGNNKLTQLNDALGNVRNFTYDKLGRLLTSQDLHATTDSTFGTSTYAYDDSGNLTQTVNPLLKTTNYTYDAIDRVLTEDSTDTGYTDIRYTYDTSVHAGIGRLGNVSTAYVGTGYDYDINGNLSAEQHIIPGSATTTTYYYYDRQQNQTYVIYPDGANVYYGYNAAGLVDYVMEIETGAPGWTTLISNLDYSPIDQVTQTQYGNSTVSINTYNAAALYRLSNKAAYNSSIYFQYLLYYYDTVGNPTIIQDAASTNSAKIVYYAYDDLHRLISASSTNAANGQNFKQTFTYNPIGNLTSNSGTSYLYQGDSGTNYANPNAATSIGGNTNTYDKEGNLLSNGSLTNLWNYRGELIQAVTSIGTSTATSTYTYDQDGNRISMNAGSITTYYPNKYYSITSGGVKEKYIYRGGDLLATIQTVGTSTKIHYSYPDHLGSSHIIANELGVVEEVIDYYPYGSSRIDISSTTFSSLRKYLGEYYDSASLLSYLNARYYDGNRARFISQDIIFQNLGTDPRSTQLLQDPQQLNAYSYSRNNPLVYKDPDGELLFVALPVILGVYGALSSYVNRENLIYTQLYPEGYTQQERDSAVNQVVWDLVTAGAAGGLRNGAETALSAGTAILDTFDQYMGESIYNKVNKKNKPTERTSVAGITGNNRTSNSNVAPKVQSASNVTSSNGKNSPNSSEAKALKNIQKQINDIQKQINKLKKQLAQKKK